MRAYIFICALLFSTCSQAFEGIFAFLKYDRDYWMEQASMAQWQTYIDEVIAIAREYGFTGLVVPPTAPISDKHDQKQMKHLRWMRDKQLLLLDHLHEAGMQAILVPGNPGSVKWARAGINFPFHSVYTHPAVVAYKQGDEPKRDEQIPIMEKGYHMLRHYYPDKPIITVFIGETIGGSTGPVQGKMQPDMLPLYVKWWKRLDTEICTVRNYWLRSRNNKKTGQFGDYDLHNPYIPKKLAVHPEKMAQLVRDNCPGEGWAFVGQTHGKCAELGKECYWRFPTETEVLEEADLAFRYGARWFLAFPLTPTPGKPGKVLLDMDLRPSRARDGSYPLHAFKTIRDKYLGKSCHDNNSCSAAPGSTPVVTVP
jgi:hypothetical protein